MSAAAGQGEPVAWAEQVEALPQPEQAPARLERRMERTASASSAATTARTRASVGHLPVGKLLC